MNEVNAGDLITFKEDRTVWPGLLNGPVAWVTPKTIKPSVALLVTSMELREGQRGIDYSIQFLIEGEPAYCTFYVNKVHGSLLDYIDVLSRYEDVA